MQAHQEATPAGKAPPPHRQVPAPRDMDQVGHRVHMPPSTAALAALSNSGISTVLPRAMGSVTRRATRSSSCASASPTARLGPLDVLSPCMLLTTWDAQQVSVAVLMRPLSRCAVLLGSCWAWFLGAWGCVQGSTILVNGRPSCCLCPAAIETQLAAGSGCTHTDHVLINGLLQTVQAGCV